MNEKRAEQAINQAETDCNNGLTETARQLIKPLYGATHWFTERGHEAAAVGKEFPPQDEFSKFAARIFPFQDPKTVLCVADLFRESYEAGYKAGQGQKA